MALTTFSTTSEVHQHFSRIARDVRENDNLVIITKKGKPFLALLPAAEVNDKVKHTVVMTRDVNNHWGKYVKQAVGGITVYIKYKDKISLQLRAIKPEEVNDIIFAYSRDLQNTHKETLQLENIKKLKSARELLNERKKLRVENNTQN